MWIFKETDEVNNPEEQMENPEESMDEIEEDGEGGGDDGDDESAVDSQGTGNADNSDPNLVEVEADIKESAGLDSLGESDGVDDWDGENDEGVGDANGTDEDWDEDEDKEERTSD